MNCIALPGRSRTATRCPWNPCFVIPWGARLPENPFAISRDRLAELDALAHRLGLALKTVALRKAPLLTPWAAVLQSPPGSRLRPHSSPTFDRAGDFLRRLQNRSIPP